MLSDEVMEKPQEPPAAVSCPLTGAYLIEASAGTGKTWTLTGIILRLLIEKNTPVQRIIATTFTRAAAKEMQERIYERLLAFDSCCEWLERYWQHQGADFLQQHSQTDRQDDDLPAIDWHQLLLLSSVTAMQDPINEHLLLFVIKAGGVGQLLDRLSKVRYRIKLLFGELDKLFVGTLDSLAQKWLREFSHEIGEYKADEVLGNTDLYVKTLVHDELRAIHAKLYHDMPLLYACIDKKQLADVEAMSKKIDNALQFYSSPIDMPKPVDNALVQKLSDRLNKLVAADITAFESYYVVEFAASQGMTKNGFSKELGRLPHILASLQTHGLAGFAKLDKQDIKWLGTLNEETITNPFNKNKETQRLVWQSLPLAVLIELGQLYTAYRQVVNDFDYYLVAIIAQSVRNKLPMLLERQQKTSFNLQMMRLVDALQGRQGRLLARHIRHLYPVALIDESQDLNGEQARLIASIYLKLADDERQKFFDKKGFLLLVGDPKQAIYRFRGGDVANYNWMKTLGLNSDYELLVNRRSNHRLIAGLNQWFGVGDKQSTDQSDGGLNHLGEGICYHAISASKTSVRLSWQHSQTPKPWLGNTPITLLGLHEGEADEAAMIAWHINALLQSDEYYQDEHGRRAIFPSDIAVLVNTHRQAFAVKHALNALNISADIAEEGNVFVGQAADELAALFEAIISLREDNLGSVLTGLFRYSLDDALELLQDDNKRSCLVLYLKQLQKLWHEDSLSAALVAAFNEPPFVADSLWAYWAGFEGSERYLADMWQLFELISVWQCHPTQVLLKMAACRHDKSESYERLAIPSPSAVQVMTIHKSKGLEFMIVYVLGLTKEISRAKDKLYPYTDNHHQRRLSPSPHKDGDDDYFANLDKQESLDESKRLGYVALTRATEQLFVVAKSMGRSRLCALGEWQILQKGQICLPPRLADDASVIMMDDLVDAQMPYQPSQLLSVAYDYPSFDEVYAQKHFYAITHTSFTRLSGQFIATQVLPVDENDESDSDVLISQDIAIGFARGAAAGTFLHTVLDLVNKGCGLQRAIQSQQQLLGLNLPPSVQDELVLWLQKVLVLPFLASEATWHEIGDDNRHSELSFVLGSKVLSGRQMMDLVRIFNEHSDYVLPDFDFQGGEIAWLVGEIDLLYAYQGKYYVVDYKSNFLGARPCDYAKPKLIAAMNEHHYWLQAALYQLALHRLLKLKIANYIGNESNYLGAVEYVFLRGLNDDNKELGRLVWQVPLALVLALDDFFAVNLGDNHDN